MDGCEAETRLDEAILRAEEHGYGKRIADIMLEHGMPPEFFYLALQESSLKIEAVGPRTRFGYAKGMWQIIPGTAQENGLKVGPLVGQPRAEPRGTSATISKSPPVRPRCISVCSTGRTRRRQDCSSWRRTTGARETP
jgi:hypothetical protein